jgi:hypothetical protein
MSDVNNPLSPSVSPLNEADPNSINILIQERLTDIFNKDPLLVTDDDLLAMVEYYQKERLRFKQESMEKELRPKGERRKAIPKSVTEAISMQDAADLI